MIGDISQGFGVKMNLKGKVWEQFETIFRCTRQRQRVETLAAEPLGERLRRTEMWAPTLDCPTAITIYNSSVTWHYAKLRDLSGAGACQDITSAIMPTVVNATTKTVQL